MRADPLRHAAPLEFPPGHALTIAGVSIPIPKGRVANLRWRREVLARAEGDPEYRETLRALCAQRSADAFLLWLNLFGWTYKQREVNDAGIEIPVQGDAVHVPFVTWPCQDRDSRKLIACIEEGRDVAGDKSRQMGMTWLVCAVFVWYLLFHANSHFMVMSRVEDLVDNPKDPLALFWKIDYLLGRLPAWLLPRLSRSSLKLVNETLGSSIVGKATAAEQGRGGALTAALIDEAAMIDVLEAVLVSLSQSTSCRIVISTPRGAGQFYQVVHGKDTPFETIRLWWFEHPEKGRGRRLAKDRATGEVYVSSPFYEAQCKRAGGRKTRTIAQELDLDHMAAGHVFFDLTHLKRQEASYCREPERRGKLAYVGEGLARIALQKGNPGAFAFKAGMAGRLAIYGDLVDDGLGRRRLAQGRTYGLGIDVSHGVGSSESAIFGLDTDSGEQVLEYASPDIRPDQLARLAVALGWWMGGVRGCAFIFWDATGGAGMAFTKAIKRVGYPWLVRSKTETKRGEKRDQRLGLWMTANAKIAMLEDLRTAIATDEVRLASLVTAKQLMGYVHYENGGVGPAILEATPAGARAGHGDRGIAAGVAVLGAKWAPLSAPVKRIAPKGSFAWRQEQAERA